jgi:hypothetical protein
MIMDKCEPNTCNIDRNGGAMPVSSRDIQDVEDRNEARLAAMQAEIDELRAQQFGGPTND